MITRTSGSEYEDETKPAKRYSIWTRGEQLSIAAWTRESNGVITAANLLHRSRPKPPASPTFYIVAEQHVGVYAQGQQLDCSYRHRK